ncbi:hypothetical protein DPMN_107462 [Dreissena polymorpha]|uniref:Mitochondria-eating protein C-terminal domain-containing protein n=1 Tax=Dreissena polymorpha TaxID=45954 RepID=A0A9D4K6T3_DREPO|nr:hypothetical protein DPMN_107462 [Dreissena polymorpha]
MSFSQRKLEAILKTVNRDLEEQGVLSERLTQDIWNNLMSHLLQGEITLAFPIRQYLQEHIRKKRQDKIYTFASIIQSLDELLDRYIQTPTLDDRHEKPKNEPKASKKQKDVSYQDQTRPQVAQHVSQTRAEKTDKPYQKSDVTPKTRPLKTAVTQTDRQSPLLTPTTIDKRETSMQTIRFTQQEASTQIRRESFAPTPIPHHDMAIETDREEKNEEDELSREQYFTMQANQSVLQTTVEDQQLKIKKLQETVARLEQNKLALMDEIKDLGTDRSDKIDVYKKAEMEIKFLRNELKIKEQSLQLSHIERNELLDRLSAVTSNKMSKTNGRNRDDETTRPSAIAEKYLKFYDSEWMDAFNVLTLEMKEEKTSINWLLDILKDVEKYSTDETTRKMVADLKKTTAKEAVAQIQVHFLKHMQKSRKDYCKDNKTFKKLTPFMDRCSELSWFMINQTPPICLDETLRQTGDDFDRDAYRFYKHHGTKLDYIVWPALYMASNEGYIFVQGIAQAKQEGVALRIASSMSQSSSKH